MKAKRAASATLQARLADVRARELGAMALDEDAVHDMRVAVRRLRAGLEAFGGGGDSKRLRRADRSLRALQDGLGAVRDQQLHVRWLRSVRGAPAVPARALAARAGADLQAARAALEVALRAWRRDGFRRVGEAIEGVSPQGRFDLRLARRALRRPLRAVGAEVAQLGSAADPRASHRLRIASKKLRYAAELYQPAAPRALRPVRLAMERLQGVLGAVQDAHVRAERLRESARRAAPRARAASLALAARARAEEGAAVAAADDELRRWRRLRRARRLVERLEEGA